MKNSFKALARACRAPSPQKLAQDELVEAQRELLAACTAREYAEAMVQYNQRRVQRLQAAVAMLQPAANDAAGPTNLAALKRAA